MSLIDTENKCFPTKYIRNNTVYASGWNACLNSIGQQPTIDAEPVKHGHLCSTDAYPHHLYCSECYKTLIPNEDICFEKNEFPKYCMWCGAKLDEEAETE